MTFTPSNLNQSPHRTIKLNPPIPFPSPQSQEPHSSQSASNDDDLTPSSRQTDSRMSTRSRRAYYTPQTPRQFSSSAAKRESVMALGSIAHLQHYFVKNGLANKDRYTLVPFVRHTSPQISQSFLFLFLSFLLDPGQITPKALSLLCPVLRNYLKKMKMLLTNSLNLHLRLRCLHNHTFHPVGLFPISPT